MTLQETLINEVIDLQKNRERLYKEFKSELISMTSYEILFSEINRAIEFRLSLLNK